MASYPCYLSLPPTLPRRSPLPRFVSLPLVLCRNLFNKLSAQYHHSITPPSLLLPLQTNDISELSISFVAGRWDQRRSSQSGPLHYLSGGGGGEVRGWVRNGNEGGSEEERWGTVTHALGGLFCAGLGPREAGENVKTFGRIYPPHRGNPDGTFSHSGHNIHPTHRAKISND